MRSPLAYFLILLLSGCIFGFIVGSPAFVQFQDGHPMSLNYRDYYQDNNLTPAQVAWMFISSLFILSLALFLWIYEVINGRRIDKTIVERRRAARRRYYRRRSEKRKAEKRKVHA